MRNRRLKWHPVVHQQDHPPTRRNIVVISSFTSLKCTDSNLHFSNMRFQAKTNTNLGGGNLAILLELGRKSNTIFLKGLV